MRQAPVENLESNAFVCIIIPISSVPWVITIYVGLNMKFDSAWTPEHRDMKYALIHKVHRFHICIFILLFMQKHTAFDADEV